MDITVIIPVYNRENLIIKTLESVLTQSERPKKVIIVDDGSTDKTYQHLSYWISENPTLCCELYRQDNAGASVARNLALSKTVTKYVVFLDSDDIWPENFLAMHHENFLEHDDIVAVSGNQIMWDEITDSKELVKLDKMAKDPISWFLRNGAGVGSCTVFLTESIRKAGGYPEHIKSGHDTVLFSRVSLEGKWHYYDDSPVIMRRNHKSHGGQAGNLFTTVPNFRFNWANNYEMIINDIPSILKRGDNRKALASRWLQAANEASANKNWGLWFRSYQKYIKHTFAAIFNR
jgi:glycosyltransferase involved in cell wall biosynthesis